MIHSGVCDEPGDARVKDKRIIAKLRSECGECELSSHGFLRILEIIDIKWYALVMCFQ